MKKMCILWAVTFVLAGIISNGYVICTSVHTSMPPSMLDIHSVVVLAISLFYFSPLLFIIHHHAKREGMKKTAIIARIGMIFFTAWNTIAIIFTILAYVKD